MATVPERNPQDACQPASSFEWQTWLVLTLIYGAWVAIIANFRDLPALPAQIALVIITAWHMSLQHELLHGHPTRNKVINRLLGLFPMSAWYPYDIYRDSHLAHHQDKSLTLPRIDPECNYVWLQDYQTLSHLRRALCWSLRTAWGRLVLGPAVTIPVVWSSMLLEPMKHNFKHVSSWAVHLLLLVSMLWWVHTQASISTLQYLFGIAYPALGLAMLRSFYEHRPAKLPAHRIVINDASLPWRLLFLNNNYHAVHHDQPKLAWYRIPEVYQADRDGFLERNGGFQIPGYGHVLWHYALKPIDSPIHPGFDPL